MSVFRPSARTQSPDGRDWEIYAYRIQLPRRAPHSGSSLEYGLRPEAQALGGLIWLLGGIGRLLVRLFVDVPVAALRALGSDEWTIEAISWAPYRLEYRWTTDREHRGQVLAQVEGGIARGERPQPRNAHFLGATD